MADWTSNNTISGDISSWGNISNLTQMYISTGMTYPMEETPEELRSKRKELIKSMIEDDDYLLQEIVTELRQDKIKKIKESL